MTTHRNFLTFTRLVVNIHGWSLWDGLDGSSVTLNAAHIVSFKPACLDGIDATEITTTKETMVVNVGFKSVNLWMSQHL